MANKIQKPKRPRGRPSTAKNDLRRAIKADVDTALSKVKDIARKSGPKISTHDEKLKKLRVEGHATHHGRVFGSRNETQRMMDAIINERAFDILDKVIELGLAGDTSCLHLLYRRVHPHTLKSYIVLPERELTTLKAVSDASKEALEYVNKGELALEDAKVISEILEARSKMIQTETIQPKLDELMKLVGLNK